MPELCRDQEGRRLKTITFAEALREAIIEEMERDPKVFIMGEDIGPQGGAFGVTKGLIDKLGLERIRPTPISEAAFTGMAIGAAMNGTRPIVEIMYIDFILLAMDQIVNQAAKMRYMFGGKAKIPLVIRTQGGAGRSNAGQHSQSLEAFFYHVPGLKVVMPSNPYDAKGLLKSAIRDDNPVIFIEHKLLYAQRGPVPENEYIIELGKADIKREGKDMTVVVTSNMVPKVLLCAEILAKEGIELEVIDPRTLYPLDIKTIVESVKKTNRAAVVHEAVKRGGIGADIACQIMEEAFDYLDGPVRRIAGLETVIPFSAILEKRVIPDEERIIAEVKEALS